MGVVLTVRCHVGLTLFLQIGKEVQKVSYQGEISIPALNMLFLEKFSYSLGQNDFPKIYIRDPSVGVSYELTDLSEVKNKSLLSLNINGKFLFAKSTHGPDSNPHFLTYTLLIDRL